MAALKAGVSNSLLSEVSLHKFAELNSDRAALLFADYCTTQGLAVNAVIHPGKPAELFGEPEQLSQIETEFNRFVQEPGHPRYQSAAWERSRVTQNQLTGTGWTVSWADIMRRPVTTLITVVCLLVYGWQQLDWQGALGSLMLSDPQQLWRWFTPALLHFSFTHLLFNLVWWVWLGRQFEQRLSGFQLASFCLSVAVLSNALQYQLAGSNFGGLSGVVYGLFGYFWVAGRINPAQGLQISNGLAGFMLLWLVLGFLDVLWVSMANWAHLGGLLAGIGWAWLLRAKPGRDTH